VSAHCSSCCFCTAVLLPVLLHTINATITAACVPCICHAPTVYKLTANIEVADVEQQVQDYIRQEVRIEAGACQLCRRRSVHAVISCCSSSDSGSPQSNREEGWGWHC
jgi:hypothetical protein